MPRLKIHLAYTGGGFQGWQVQSSGRTVQGCLEAAICKICETHVRVHGAGRTDAGAHALEQVAHCDIPENKTKVPWQKALNALLPSDIAVTHTEWTSPDFHSRINAEYKIYSYTLWTYHDYILPQRNPFVWQVKHLDVEKMYKGKEILLGTHDFAAFENVGTNIENTVRTMYWIKDEPGFYPDKEMVWRFAADGFLKQMARNLISALVEMGRGKLTPGGLEDILASRDRTRAPATAPAKGLCLEKIAYSV